jgi:hypothetical protein
MTLSRYLSRQKQYFKYRAINPALYLIDRLKIHNIGLALVSDLDAPSSEQQFHPFSACRAELRDKLQVISSHLMLKDVLRGPRTILRNFDIVGLKLSYRTPADKALHVIGTIRRAIGSKKPLVYFDGDDDICIQWPEMLPYIHLYVKKHAFRDREMYLKEFIGKSNLHDYVCRTHNYTVQERDYGNPGEPRVMIPKSGPVPIAQLDKIFVGYGLALDKPVMDLYKQVKDYQGHGDVKNYDIVFRGTVLDVTISYYLRRNVAPILRQMEGYKTIIPGQRVSQHEYYQEMISSKICVSPFGYGEICWRDYEAVLCRCLLIKPDMGHVETDPDIFQPYKTYVPVKWDFSDLKEKCEYYLQNDEERQRIVSAAYDTLVGFYERDGFVNSVNKLMNRSRCQTERPLRAQAACQGL